MKQNETNKMPKNAEVFSCEKCNFTCFKKSNYDTHLATRKHKMKQIKRQKTPQYFPVKNATLLALKKVNGIDTSPHESMK